MSGSATLGRSGSLGRAASASSARLLLFGVLTVAGGALWLYAWFQPWWDAYIVALKEYGVTIFPHAMVVGGTLKDYPQWLVGAEMPSWFFPAMWFFLAACIGALVFSLFVFEDRIRLFKWNMSLPTAVVGAVGVAFLVFVIVFALVVAIRAPVFYGASLQGAVFIHMAEHEGAAESYVNTKLEVGYWLACAAGAFLVVLALLRDKIVGYA